MVYPEVEQRRGMLRVLLARIEANTAPGLLLSATEVHALGAEVALTPRASEQRFIRLLEEGYIRATRQKDGRLYYQLAQAPFGGAYVTDLTDKGLRAIDLLPPENSVEGVAAALEDYLQRVDQDMQLPPEEKARKRTALERMRDVLRDTATKVGPRVLGELITRGIGM